MPVLIPGAGTIGAIIARARKLKRAKTVICCDISDSSLERSKLFGADYTINSKTQDIAAELRKITDGHGCAAACFPGSLTMVMPPGILCRETGKIMLEKGCGKIITISSMVSWFGGQTVPAYTAAKGGVAQLTKELSNDWIARGVNVNSLAPGYMATEMNAALLDPKNPRYQQLTDRIPADRWGTGDDMKGACIFLAPHASDYLGGASR